MKREVGKDILIDEACLRFDNINLVKTLIKNHQYVRHGKSILGNDMAEFSDKDEAEPLRW